MAVTANAKDQFRRWSVIFLLLLTGAYLGLQLYAPAAREVPTARVERREFIMSIRARGEIKARESVKITTPPTPDLKIVRLAEDGKPIKKGEIVVEFDGSVQEERFVQRATEVRQVDSEIVQARAQHSIADELNAMLVMSSEYNLERAKLEASKQEILSEIEGLKNRIDVDVSGGELSKAKTTAQATDISQEADITRLTERKNKAIRDLDLTKTYLRNMILRAPADGIVQIRSNPRAQGSSRRNRPPFQEGDTVWAGADIAEIPNLSSMRVEFRVEEIDRGRASIGPHVRIRVDAAPGTVFEGSIDWLSPIATLLFRRFPPEKNFPAQATIDNMDAQLRPGMSASVEVIVEQRPGVLIIPTRASFQVDGEPTVFVRQGSGFRKQRIKVLARNATDIVVGDALKEGEVIALENPILANPKG